MSCVPCQVIFFLFFQSGKTSRRRVCYQRGLTCLVTSSVNAILKAMNDPVFLGSRMKVVWIFYLRWKVFHYKRQLYYRLPGPSLMKPQGLFGMFESSYYKQHFWRVVRWQTTMKHVADWVCTTRPAMQQQHCPRNNVTLQNRTSWIFSQFLAYMT